MKHPVFSLNENFHEKTIDMRSDELDCGFVLVTPDIARAMLGHNEVNRTLRDPHVQELATSISHRTFDVTHQGIAFWKNGILADGQHRLLAIIEANAPATLLVVVGLDYTPHIDRGLKRTESDVIRMAKPGMRWVNKQTTAIINILWTEFPKLNLITLEDKIQYLKAYTPSIQFSLNTYKKPGKHLSSSAIYAAFMCAHADGCDPEKLTRAAKALSTGMNPSDGLDPYINTIFALRNWLMNLAMNSGNWKNHIIFYASAQTLKNYLNNKSIKQIRLPESFPFSVRDVDNVIVN